MENRIYKFRAWNKPTNQMIYWPSIQFMLNNENTTYHDRRNFEPEDNDFMQFTGLHDKNDKDIYEGDICRTFFNGNPFHFGEVKFYERKLQFCLGVAPLADLELEVIGNIYENKDLLK